MTKAVSQLTRRDWLAKNYKNKGHGVGINADFMQCYLARNGYALVDFFQTEVGSHYSLLSVVEPAYLPCGYTNLDAVGGVSGHRRKEVSWRGTPIFEDTWSCVRREILEECGVLLPRAQSSIPFQYVQGLNAQFQQHSVIPPHVTVEYATYVLPDNFDFSEELRVQDSGAIHPVDGVEGIPLGKKYKNQTYRALFFPPNDKSIKQLF
eukprot:CAMPEP_0117811014 /NCGR_PEP_ID=MMETSP0948-20121206/21843_1 /TAXON_ID=44440 /ORGANISM="Chattonella subsalsa, Strain CCMP2191" /LENGTH=206 /DNA_ID=CAMNT_0005647463 /DNA_START=18 /DNA_END=638 /DNA_ORIENTATION=-